MRKRLIALAVLAAVVAGTPVGAQLGFWVRQGGSQLYRTATSTTAIVIRQDGAGKGIAVQGAAGTDAWSVSSAGKFGTYNGVTTAGVGVPVLVAAARATAQTAANASVATYTAGAADGSFIVSANVLVTTSTTHSFNVNVVYTDEGNTARTVPMLVIAPGSVSAFLIANAQGAVPWSAIPMHIRCKASTAITVTTSGTFTTVTYNVDGLIWQAS